MTNNNFKKPLVSFGTIIFLRTEDKVEFVIQQRRDTFDYMNFLLGIWGSRRQLAVIFKHMSIEERERLIKYNFEELWKDLFVTTDSNLCRDFYNKAKRRFAYCQECIPHLIETTVSRVKEPPWGFPKGKKNSNNETDLECAIRETEEEIGISRDQLNIYPSHTFYEKFKGTTNNKTYEVHYFLAELKSKYIPTRRLTPHCIRTDSISEEVSNLMYITEDEAKLYISKSRHRILQEAMEVIKNI